MIVVSDALKTAWLEFLDELRSSVSAFDAAQLLNSVNSGFSDTGVNFSGRAIGTYPSGFFVRDEAVTDALSLKAFDYEAVTGEDEIGAGSPEPSAVRVSDSGLVAFLCDGLGPLAYVARAGAGGPATFTNTHESSHSGPPSKDGQFFMAEKRYSLSEAPYYDDEAIGGYGMVRQNAGIFLVRLLRTLLGAEPSDWYFGDIPVEIYYGEMPGSPFEADPGAELAASGACAKPVNAQGTIANPDAVFSHDEITLNLRDPITIYLPNPAPDAMWARLALDGSTFDVAIPIYSRRAAERSTQWSGGLVIDADRFHPGDLLRFSQLKIVQPLGELGRGLSAGFTSSVYAASAFADAIELTLLRTGTAAASLRASTEDGTALAGVHYEAVENVALSWAEGALPGKVLPITLIPLDVPELSFSAADSPPVADAGEGSADDSADDAGNPTITMNWEDGAVFRATLATPMLDPPAGGQSFQLNLKIVNRGQLLRLVFGYDATYSDYGFEIDDEGLSIDGTPLSLPGEPSILSLRVEAETVTDSETDEESLLLRLKRAVNGRWFEGGTLHDDASDIDGTILPDLDQFFFALTGETTEDRNAASVQYWIGTEKALTFSVHLTDPSPAGLFAGGAITTAKVTIFGNRLADDVVDTYEDSMKFRPGESAGGTISGNGYEFTLNEGGLDPAGAIAGFFRLTSAPHRFIYLESSIALGSLCTATYQMGPGSFGFGLSREGNPYWSAYGPFYIVRSGWAWDQALSEGEQDPPFAFEIGDEVRLGLAVDLQEKKAKCFLAKSGTAYWVQFTEVDEDFVAAGPATFHASIDDVDWFDFNPANEDSFLVAANFIGGEFGEATSSSDVVKVVAFAGDQLYRPEGFSALYEGTAP